MNDKLRTPILIILAAAVLVGPFPVRPLAARTQSQAQAQTPPKAAAAQDQLRMTLSDCLARALERNPEIAAEALNPAISGAALREAREDFLPVLDLSYKKISQTTLGTWGVEGTEYTYKYDYYYFYLSEKLPTGTELSVAFTNSMTDTGRAYTVINPSYSSELEVSVTQPLLKGFGAAANLTGVRKAERTVDSARAALEVKLAKTVYELETAYWALANDIENLGVLEKALEQSKAILARARDAARIGAESGLEVLSAETEVARWEDGVVSARLAIQQAEDTLRQLMNMPPRGGGPGDAGITPADAPEVGGLEPDLETATAAALRNRPEMIIAENDLASAMLDVKYYRNQALPQLDLVLSGWLPGQSGVTDTYQGSRWDSIRDMFDAFRKSWSAGLNFELPLASVTSRAALAGARLKGKQEALFLENTRLEITHEVAAAVKEVANMKLKTASAANYRALLEKKLAAEMERFNLGLVGSEWLFNYQSQLATARASEIQAAVDYRLARARLDKATGTLLENRHIRFRAADEGRP